MRSIVIDCPICCYCGKNRSPGFNREHVFGQAVKPPHLIMRCCQSCNDEKSVLDSAFGSVIRLRDPSSTLCIPDWEVAKKKLGIGKPHGGATFADGSLVRRSIHIISNEQDAFGRHIIGINPTKIAETFSQIAPYHAQGFFLYKTGQFLPKDRVEIRRMFNPLLSPYYTYPRSETIGDIIRVGHNDEMNGFCFFYGDQFAVFVRVRC